jgi:hypothetical protein
MTPLTIALDAADARVHARHVALLATLPARLRATDAPGADVVVVTGSRPGWPEDAAEAVRGGARGVLVAEPATGDPGTVRALEVTAADAGAVVAVESPVLDATWQTALPRLRASLAGAALVHGLVAAAPAELAAGRLGLLALARSLTGGLDELNAGDGDWISGRAGEVPVALSCTPTTVGRPQLRIDVIAPGEQWRAVFDPSALATPTRISGAHADGLDGPPDHYETHLRAAWRHLAGDAPAPYTLSDLAADLELSARAS